MVIVLVISLTAIYLLGESTLRFSNFAFAGFLSKDLGFSRQTVSYSTAGLSSMSCIKIYS